MRGAPWVFSGAAVGMSSDSVDDSLIEKWVLVLGDSKIWREWSPAVDSIGFIAAPLDECVEHILRWRRGLVPGFRRVRSKTGNWSFEEKMDRLDPLAIQSTVELLCTTRSGGWTAYFDNGLSGADPAPLSYFAELLQATVVNVQYSPPSSGVDSRWGNCQLNIFYPGRKSRSIAVAEDESGWIFEAWGDPEPWEDVARYALQRKVERFTYETLIAYCRKLGIDPFCTDFYGNRSSLIEIRPPWRVIRLTKAEYASRGWSVNG